MVSRHFEFDYSNVPVAVFTAGQGLTIISLALNLHRYSISLSPCIRYPSPPELSS